MHRILINGHIDRFVNSIAQVKKLGAAQRVCVFDLRSQICTLIDSDM